MLRLALYRLVLCLLGVLALAAPASAQVVNLCPETITYRQRIGLAGLSTSPGTGAGGALTASDLDANFAALAHICGAQIRAEDWGTALAAGCVLEAQADGSIACGAAGGGGSAISLDLGNDATLESTGITAITTTGDTNAVFTEPSADELRVDVSQPWPQADLASALAPAGLDDLAEITSGLRTGTASQLVTGTAGVSGRCAEWSGTGDLVASAGVCGGGGTGASLDLGNDATLESTGITAITTTGDTNAVFTEPSADELRVDVSQPWPQADLANALAPAGLDDLAEIASGLRTGTGGQLVTGTSGVSGRCAEWSGTGDLVASSSACGTGGGGGGSGEYDPDTEVGLSVSESFDDAVTPDLIWRVYNDADSSLVMDLNGVDGTATLREPVATASNKLFGWWTNPPSGPDPFACWAKLGWAQFGSFAQGGVAALTGGTEASPTEIFMSRITYNGRLAGHEAFNYTTLGAATVEQELPHQYTRWAIAVYLYIAWDGTSLIRAGSADGLYWIEHGSPVATARPTAVGLYLVDAGTNEPYAIVRYFRCSTSAAALAKRIGG